VNVVSRFLINVGVFDIYGTFSFPDSRAFNSHPLLFKLGRWRGSSLGSGFFCGCLKRGERIEGKRRDFLSPYLLDLV
jgi:hypothetical protein